MARGGGIPQCQYISENISAGVTKTYNVKSGYYRAGTGSGYIIDGVPTTIQSDSEVSVTYTDGVLTFYGNWSGGGFNGISIFLVDY